MLSYECSQSELLEKILRRHLGVIVDYMAYRGTLTFIPRFSVGANPDIDPLEKMTFETAGNFLRESLKDGRWNDIRSTIPTILYGITPPYGAGISKVSIMTDDICPESENCSPDSILDKVAPKGVLKEKKKKMSGGVIILPIDKVSVVE